MMGTAWPSDSTRRSAAGSRGCSGRQRIVRYISAAVRCASESALVGWPLPAAVVARTASLAMAIALALMSWLSVAMELSLIRFDTARRRSDAWSTDAWIGYRLGRRKTRRHLD